METRAEESPGEASERLINKAIKRILLDIVIRGHGDRLIGRWSREPELQQFLEQVPYLLDRINQLHLACSRVDPQQERLEHAHHHHHHHHHHEHHHEHHANKHKHHHCHAHHKHKHSIGINDAHQVEQPGGQSSLAEVMGLIGEQRHWLVRTRDALGLTPLHKAVLANNWPVAEYLVDRYQDELAASSWPSSSRLAVASQENFISNQSQQAPYLKRPLARCAGLAQVSLIDAQDKYGRSALHYAAALLGSARTPDETTASAPKHLDQEANLNRRNLSQLYHFLLAKGASLEVRDFRGRTAAHYVRHPNQLRAKSIVHLANKLNANYQANVLSKTLQAHANLANKPEALEQLDCQQANSLEISSPTLNAALNCELAAQKLDLQPELNRESMSVSSNDLREPPQAEDADEALLEASSPKLLVDELKRSRSSTNLSVNVNDDAYLSSLQVAEGSRLRRGQVRTGGELTCNEARTGVQVYRSLDSGGEQAKIINEPQRRRLARFGSETRRQRSVFKEELEEPEGRLEELEAARKQLLADRCARLILDKGTKLRVKSALSEGKVEKVSELLVEGLGDYLLSEAKVFCWNLTCKRYINQVIPELLKGVDALHELIALNKLEAIKELLSKEPILARIRRPYRRASMNALHLAAQLDRRSTVEFLLASFAELLTSLDSHGASCLHWAAKSLSKDKLYAWLLDCFGHQIEHLRDHKNKTAADYKLQAYKLFNFSSAHPQAPIKERGARHFMRRAQVESNKLQLSGARCELSQRPATNLKAFDKRKANASNETPGEGKSSFESEEEEEEEAEAEAEEQTLDQSIEFNLDSTCETPTKQQQNCDDSFIREEQNQSSSPTLNKNDDTLHLASHLTSSSTNQSARFAYEPSDNTGASARSGGSGGSGVKRAGRRASSASLNSNQAHKEDLVKFARGRRLSDPNAPPLCAKQLNQRQLPKVSELEHNENINQQNDDQLELMNEMVQLDSVELGEERLDKFTYRESPEQVNRKGNSIKSGLPLTINESNKEQEDSPLTTPSLPSPTCFAASSSPQSTSDNGSQSRTDRKRQQRNSKLDQLIASSITCADYKKLEHLILAGCGKRILKVFAKQFEGKPNLPIELEQFLKVQTPSYISKIQEIHQVLHRCYASFESTSNDDGRLNSDEELHSQVNAAFHKLCNLLDRRRLIVCRDSFGAAPLHLAAMRSDARLIEYLLRRHPEAASAPDHDNRNVCHYAALAFKTFAHHGPVRLINTIQEETQSRGLGFWFLDEQSRITYENLRFRYGELLKVQDRYGLSCEDYLSGSSSQNHQNSASLDCCEEYLKLLNRYNYVPVFPDQDGSTINLCGAQPARGDNFGSRSNSNKQRLAKLRADSHEKNMTKRQGGRVSKSSPSSSPKSKTADESIGRLLMPAAIENPPFEFGALSAAKQVAPKPTVGSDHGFPQLSQSSNYRTAQDSLGPRTFSSLNSGRKSGDCCSKQQSQGGGDGATKQTPGFKVAPFAEQELRFESGCDTPTSVRRRSSGGSHAHKHKRHQGSAESVENNHHNHHQTSSSAKRNQHHHQHHHHHHHKRRHHHHHHNKRRQHKSTQEPAAVNSLVGGVIVPTIIHNDRMDEIETYDIIYRQPAASSSAQRRNSSSSSSRSSSISSSSLCNSSCSALSSRADCNSASEQDDDGDGELCAVGALSATEQVSRPESRVAGADEAGSSESSSASSDLESSDEDERVERLSSEFENRVRREKSELRAKVDQIMNEIKLSAKSGKSTRFLASPIDPAAAAAAASAGNKQKPARPGAGGGSSTVLFVDQRQTMAKKAQESATAATKQQQSLSSSGHSSARTSCSSASSLNSNASSCASHSISNTNTNTCSSTSSGTGSAIDERSLKSAASSTRSPIAAKSHQQEAKVSSGAQPNVNNKTRTDSSEHESELSKLAQQVISKNTYGQTYLHFIASRSQNSSTLYKVLEHARHLIGERDIFYRTARDVAVQFNLANNVQVLDKFVIDLFIAGNTTLLRYLLNQGYSPLIHVSDSDGNDIMLILKLLKLDRMIHYLLQMADFQRWRDELHTFIRNGYSAGVSELIRKHKDLIRARSVHARTSLHLAVLFDRPGMVRELIEADPTSVHALDNMGRTALHYTYGLHLKNLEEIRDCLLANGASLNTRDVKMRTPKYYYIFKREIEDIRRIELELN